MGRLARALRLASKWTGMEPRLPWCPHPLPGHACCSHPGSGSEAFQALGPCWRPLLERLGIASVAFEQPRAECMQRARPCSSRTCLTKQTGGPRSRTPAGHVPEF